MAVSYEYDVGDRFVYDGWDADAGASIRKGDAGVIVEVRRHSLNDRAAQYMITWDRFPDEAETIFDYEMLPEDEALR